MKKIKINYSGKSTTSLLDAGIGLGVGLAVPKVMERVLQVPAVSSLPAVLGNERYWAAGIGAVASLGLAYWRGMGAATVAFVAAVLYGLGPLLEEQVLDRVWSGVSGLLPAGNGNGTSASGDPGLLTAQQLGLLTATQDTGRLVVETSGQQAAVGSGNMGAFGTVGF